jgi:hypothetical protein
MHMRGACAHKLQLGKPGSAGTGLKTNDGVKNGDGRINFRNLQFNYKRNRLPAQINNCYRLYVY